jgi:hypothetical protein
MTAAPVLAALVGALVGTWEPGAGGSAGQPGAVRLDPTRFDSVTAVALRGVLDSAAAQGLPVAPLVNRAYEGAARRVGGARLLTVVRAHWVALGDAREALGDGSTVAELDAGATALRAGIDPRALQAVRTARPPGEGVTALVVLTDLVRRGVPTATAREAVTTLARLPGADDALLGLQGVVARGASQNPDMAVQALQRYIQRTVPVSRAPAGGGPAMRPPTRPPPP